MRTTFKRAFSKYQIASTSEVQIMGFLWKYKIEKDVKDLILIEIKGNKWRLDLIMTDIKNEIRTLFQTLVG